MQCVEPERPTSSMDTSSPASQPLHFLSSSPLMQVEKQRDGPSPWVPETQRKLKAPGFCLADILAATIICGVNQRMEPLSLGENSAFQINKIFKKKNVRRTPGHLSTEKERHRFFVLQKWLSHFKMKPLKIWVDFLPTSPPSLSHSTVKASYLIQLIKKAHR